MKYLLMIACLILSVPPLSASSQPDLLEISIEDLQEELNSGKISSVELVSWYLSRIAAYDQQGPTLNAIQHFNAAALEDAAALDI